MFGGRDESLLAVFDRYGPIVELSEAVSDAEADLTKLVHRIYRLLAEASTREPRVAPAMLAEGLARPTASAMQALVQHIVPRMLAGLGQWLVDEVAAERIRDLPLPLLIHQLPPALANAPEVDLPELDEACTVFADAFLRGASTGDAQTHRR